MTDPAVAYLAVATAKEPGLPAQTIAEANWPRIIKAWRYEQMLL
jgi:hypothetical protein